MQPAKVSQKQKYKFIQDVESQHYKLNSIQKNIGLKQEYLYKAKHPQSKSKLISDTKNARVEEDFTFIQKIKILLIPIAFITLVFLMFDIYQFSQYLHVSRKAKNNEEVDHREILYRLQWLTSLTLPVFRQYFYQQKIYELGVLKEWNQLVIQADKALAFAGNSKKFSIYYHKAIGLCFLQRFKQCRFAADQALRHVSRQNAKNLHDIYNILVSNNLIKSSQVPTATLFYTNQLKHQNRVYEENQNEKSDMQNIRLESL